MKIKLNVKFEKARQKRFDEKEPEYGGKDNPKNYKNMSIAELMQRIIKQGEVIDRLLIGRCVSFGMTSKNDILKKELVDTANFCGMLWEKLGDK